MPRPLKLTGKTFGKLFVICKSHKSKRGQIYWLCRCSCGVTKPIRASNLTKNLSKSCGCGQIEAVTSHGMTRTREFRSWESMKQRCMNENSPDYENYGGRGIKVCNQWINDFDQFYKDMGVRPKGFTLDRKDVNGDYNPENCRWANCSDQQRNRRCTRFLEYEGKTLSIPEWSDKTGLSTSTISNRLKSGWSVEKALTTKSRKRGKEDGFCI